MHDINNAVSLANYITAAIFSLLGAIGLWRFKARTRMTGDVSAIVRGGKYVMTALAGHQIYWGTGRLGIVIGRQDIADWINGHAALATVFYFAAFYGMLKILAVGRSQGGQIRPVDAVLISSLWTTIVVVVLY